MTMRRALFECGRRSFISSSIISARSSSLLRRTVFLSTLSQTPTWMSYRRSSTLGALAVPHSFQFTTSPDNNHHGDEGREEGESSDGWEEEDEVEPKLGDGGDGGGVVLGDVPWGERTLSIAHEVLVNFNDMKLYSYKTSPRGYIYVRLDKISNRYGCPSMDEIENFSNLYNKRLEEVGECGEIPMNLALEVSSPGAERILKVPNDLDRFKELPMRVSYMESVSETKFREKESVLFLDSIETESERCVWKLANVKVNRDLSVKGRSLSRKQRDWRLKLPFSKLLKVTLYLEL